MESNPSISIVIPTWNEAKHLPALLSTLKSLSGKEFIKEIIVCDGSSTDDTVSVAEAFGVTVIGSSKRQRAHQMNLGAKQATGDFLYFLHADSIPPTQTIPSISEKVRIGYASGCFRMAFDINHWFLNANAWFTRFPQTVFRFGDQSLFVNRHLFISIGGYDESLFLMEDQEILYRIKQKGRFVVMPQTIITSARKYAKNGIYRLQFIFYTIYLLYHLGLSQESLKKIYTKWIKA